MSLTQAEHHIRAIVRSKGSITFARFMELALYGPDGYYTKPNRIGATGDFFTSPLAHPLFGAMIALQLEQMWELMDHPRQFAVIEPGAGNGQLSRDVLNFKSQLREGFTNALDYRPIDGWRPGLPTVTSGCFLSNELLDAFPVHRVRKVDGKLLEIYVTLDGGRFVEQLQEPSTPRIQQQLASEDVNLGDDWTAEISLEAVDWMQEVASNLTHGYVITIDYGDMAEHLFTERRRHGTMMSYYQHTKNADPFARIGQQDLTAHVDFTAMIKAGAARGLLPVAIMTQQEFLTNLGADLFLDVLRQSKTAGEADLKGVRSLLDPAGLGNLRVLIQAKAAEVERLACLAPNATFKTQLAKRLARGLRLPRLTAAHINQLAGRPGGWMEWNPPR